MFVVVYEFIVADGKDEVFTSSWLNVTKAFYAESGSLGSRLHKTQSPSIYVAYAQWPSKESWSQANLLLEGNLDAFSRMRECLVSSKVVYELEVDLDYLKSETK